ncbi:hypothetical protein ACIRBX_36475 [Kitasatospora sp. NPDC096147]|uniref:hypothetical protein n=1 Tax=Kitasatospora sp. NPDC096147 TaxID=3364093 RepID=UPI0037F3FF68
MPKQEKEPRTDRRPDGGVPADRSYGDTASDHAEPAAAGDNGQRPVRQDYDATAESAAAEGPSSPYRTPREGEPPADDGSGGAGRDHR